MDELNKFLAQIKDPTVKRSIKDLFKSLVEDGNSAAEAVAKIKFELKGMSDTAESTAASFKAITQEIAKGNDNAAEARRTYKNLTGLARQLQYEQEGIVELSEIELKKMKSKAQQQVSILKSVAEEARRRIKAGKSLDDAEKSALTASEEKFESEKQFIADLETRILKQQEVSKYVGLTGAALDNLNKIGIRAFGGLGINLGLLNEGLEEARQSAKKAAEELILSNKGQKSFLLISERFKTLGATLPGIGKAFMGAVSDPLSIVLGIGGKLVKAYKEVDKEATEYARLTGETAEYVAKTGSRFASITDYTKLAAELTKELGFNASLVFSDDVLAAGAELVNLLGLSQKEMGNLAKISGATNTNLNSNVDSLVDSVNQFNRANKTAVAHGKILRDVSNTSSGITAALGGSVNALAQAASAAARLGLELKDLDQIANSLLDFESSIENELQAQLLTGKEINLNKARELALTNNLAGLGEELFKNSADLYEYGSMNRIAQEGYAKALGISRDQLATIAYNRALESKLTGEALQKATGLTSEELKRMEVAEAIAKAQEKLAQTFAPILRFVTEYADIITGVAVTYGTLVTSMKVMKNLTILQSALEARKGALIGGQNVALAVQTSLKRKGVAADTASMVANVIANPGKALLGIGLAAGATALVMGALRKADDFVDLPSGYNKRGLAHFDKGGIQVTPINNNDTILGGTNLTSSPTTTNSSINSNKEVLNRLDQMITALNKKGTILMDGNKVGETLVLGSYKSS